MSEPQRDVQQDLSDLPMQLVRLGSQLADLMPQSRGFSIVVKADPECPMADVVIKLRTTATVDEVMDAEPAITAAIIDHPLSLRGLSIIASFDFEVVPDAQKAGV